MHERPFCFDVLIMQGYSDLHPPSREHRGQKQVDGQCGRCDGTKADTIGIYEFDTNSETVISRIFGSDGSTGVPAVSPDGSKCIRRVVVDLQHFLHGVM